MLTRVFISALLACLAVVSQPQPSQAVTCGTWKEAEKSIRWYWEKAAPTEKILTIEQNGPPQTYSKVQSTNQKKIDEYGNEWEYYQKNPYCSVPAKLKVQQTSGPRIFNVSAVFKVSGRKFTFDDVAVGGSEALLEPGQALAPDVPEIKKIITEAYMANIPADLHSKIQVDKVMIAPRTLSRWDGGQSGYSMASVDMYLIIDGERKDKCEVSLVNLYKGDEKNMRLDAAGLWKVEFRIKQSMYRCTGKYQSRVSDFVNKVEVKAPPPPVDTSWMKEAVGTYKGEIEDELVNQGTTVLSMGSNGKISGTFTYTERKFQSEGEIYNCTPVKENELKCSWKNQKSMGMLIFNFDSSRSSFTGRWWGRAEKDSSKWDGKKTSGTVPAAASGAAGQPEVTPPPALKNIMKGFGF